MSIRKVRLKRKVEPEKVTRKGRFIFVILIIFCAIGFVAGVRLAVAHQDSGLTGTSDLKSKGLYYQLKMERTNYNVGEPINVKLLVKNLSASPVTLKFQKNLEFDLTVRKEVNLLFAQVPKIIWKLSETKLVVPEPHIKVIDPGQTEVFTGTWNQQTRDGESVKPGNYQIIGNLLADDRKESLTLRGRTEDQ